MYYLGTDIGSVSAKFVLLDENKKIIDKVYLKNENIMETLKQGLGRLKKDIKAVGITGSGRELVSKILGADIIVTEIIAHATASLNYYPEVKTIIDIGGEDSKLILIKNQQIDDFVMNTDCGGGTGAMIETICQRLGVNLEEAGNLALTSKTNLSLPSKCGVFCQSAIVSKKNMGVPSNDLLMAVFRGMVSNYLAIHGKGKDLQAPIMFQGACAKNSGLVASFKEELNTDIIVPKNCEFMGAIGSALLAEKVTKTKFKGINKIINTNYNSNTIVSNGCANKCEIINIYGDEGLIAKFGNRCDKCT